MTRSKKRHQPAGLARSSGFTLIELLIAAAILALLTGMAAPSFRTFSANQRIRSASFDLVSDLILARSEAVKRNGEVRLEPNDEDWQNGWTVTVVDSGERLHRRDALGDRVRVSEDAPEAIRFDRNGRLSDVLGVVQIGLESTAAAGISARCISIDPSGRPRTVREWCE